MKLKLTRKEEICIMKGDIKAIERYLCFHPFRKIVLEDAVIATGNEFSMVKMAKVRGANIEKLEDGVIATRNAGAMVEMAKVPGANITKLEAAVIARGNPWAMIDMAKIPGANIEKLEDGVIATGNAAAMVKMARVPGANKPKLENEVIALGDAAAMVEMARVPGANKPKLENEVIALGDAAAMVEMARVPGANKPKLENEVIAIGDAAAMVEMAKVPGANKPKLEDAVIALGDVDAMVEMARYPGTNTVKLEDAIMKSCNIRAIKEFLTKIKRMILPEIQNYMTNCFSVKEYLDTYKRKKSNVDQLRELLNLLTLDKVTSLFNQGLLPKEVFQDYLHRLNKEKIIYEEANKIDNTWLVNLSLTEPNVLPSMVKENREVLENTKLYLELLKKMNSDKYYDYKDAFEGKISFEDADKYYTYRYQKLK